MSDLSLFKELREHANKHIETLWPRNVDIVNRELIIDMMAYMGFDIINRIEYMIQQSDQPNRVDIA